MPEAQNPGSLATCGTGAPPDGPGADLRFFHVLFYKFFDTIRELFTLRNVVLELVAVALTYLFVSTDFDWVYNAALKDAFPRVIFPPALLLGTFLPIFGTLFLYIWGRKRCRATIVNTAGALGQAALLGWLFSSTLKAFTGRIPPVVFEAATTNISHGFRFGFLKGGIFWGWPSSHTTVAFAMAFVMIALFPENKKVRIASFLYALYIGLAVSVSIHWFSEFVAGGIFGTIIGLAVGKNFLGCRAVVPIQTSPPQQGINLQNK